MTKRQIKQPVAGRKSWRDVLSIHPAAAAYPRLDAKALEELGADIKQRGLQVDVVLLRVNPATTFCSMASAASTRSKPTASIWSLTASSTARSGSAPATVSGPLPTSIRM